MLYEERNELSQVDLKELLKHKMAILQRQFKSMKTADSQTFKLLIYTPNNQQVFSIFISSELLIIACDLLRGHSGCLLGGNVNC